MKLPELKEKLKSKYIVRVVAGVLTIALVGTGIGATAVFADKADNTAVTSEASSESASTDDIADDLLGSISAKDEDTDKDESVYLISDANGNVNKTIVVDHLNNKDKKDTIEDASNLSDIENVKGKETFEQNGDKLTWQAGGNDIYYQGTATDEPPVTQKVTYYLDDKEISPEDLAGKSGKVKIRFDYENTTSFTETVNGEKQTVSVPFAAVTALMLGDGFKNVEVTNGKVEANDTSNIVIGYALPGLKDSLGIKDEDMDDDVNIPEYMEVTADVEDFSLSTAMTFVVNASDYVTSDGIDTSSLDDMITELQDASTQLQDGSAELATGADTLADGVGTLQDSLGTFATGMGTLKSGLKSYTDGASKLNAGINTLGNSTDALVDGAGQLNSGAGQLASGSKTLKDGVKSYTDGASKVNAGLNELGSNAGTLAAGVTSLNEGAQSLEAGINSANGGAAQVSAGAAQLKSGIDTAKSGADELADGTAQVKDGVDQLEETLSDMSAKINAVINSSLQQLNDMNVGKLLHGLEYISEDTISADNVSAAAEKSVANETGIKNALAAQTAGNPTATYDVLSVEQKAVIDNTYNRIIADLSNGAGAVSVYAQVSKGIEDSASSVGALKDGSSQVAAGAKSLDDGLGTLSTGASALETGASDLAKGTSQLATGATALKAGTQSLADSIPTLTSGIKQLVDGSNTLVSNNNTLNAGATALNTGANQLAAGTQSLADKIPSLTSGIKQLVDGSNTLVSNNDALNSGAAQLSDGTTQIVSGVDKLADGSKELADGAHTLADGMVQFNEEGINKILDAYNGDLKPVVNKLQAVIDAGEDYQTYSAIADGQTGSVKFIYKLASIEADEK